MSRQINIIDYRNGRYQGFLKDENYHGWGAILDDDFTFYLSHWTDNQADGPCFLIFPDEKLFYGSFYQNRAYGPCCYDLGN